jgi:hypothetical protein
MFDDDLFAQQGVTGFGTPVLKLRTDFLKSLRAGPPQGEDDLTTAIVLARLVRSELEAYGTDGSERLSDSELELAQRVLRTVLHRLEINLSLPSRDFASFKSYWLKNGACGSWQARRDIIAKFFDPVHDELDRREEEGFRAVLAEGVSPRAATGWAKVGWTPRSDLLRTSCGLAGPGSSSQLTHAIGFTSRFLGGAKGNRTPDLLDANETTWALAAESCIDIATNPQVRRLALTVTKSCRKFYCGLAADWPSTGGSAS